MRSLKDVAPTISLALVPLAVLLALGTQASGATLTLDPTTFGPLTDVDQTIDGTPYNVDFGSCTSCSPNLDAYLIYPPPSSNLGEDVIEAITGDLLSLLYKDNDPGGIESGSFAGNYTTVFSPAGDPIDADITWDGGAFISDASWLEVKDGNHDPTTYLFDISSWDGMMLLDLNNFWPTQGAISHVSIWGGGTITLPEPGTLSLLAIGFAGIAWVRRRKVA